MTDEEYYNAVRKRLQKEREFTHMVKMVVYLVIIIGLGVLLVWFRARGSSVP